MSCCSDPHANVTDDDHGHHGNAEHGGHRRLSGGGGGGCSPGQEYPAYVLAYDRGDAQVRNSKKN